MLGRVSTRRTGSTINQDLNIKLSDISGNGKFVIKDADGATVFSVDSKGNVKSRGQVSRI